MIEAPYNKQMQQTVTALAKARPAPATDPNRYRAMSAAVASFRFQPETEDY